jgi:Tol biopolymer transport system component
MTTGRLLTVTAAAFALGAVAFASSEPARADGQQAPRLMTVKDTQSFVNVGGPAISPDDQWVLYTRSVRDWDDAQLRNRTHIWRVRIDGTAARQLTFGDANTTSPAWFPDGTRIAFVSSRGSGGSGRGGGSGDEGDQ